MNKLWILRPVKFLSKSDNPWAPWYDKAFGFVVCAPTEEDARKLAHSEAGDENDGSFLGKQTAKTKAPWLDSKYSTCLPLEAGDKAQVVMRDFASA